VFHGHASVPSFMEATGDTLNRLGPICTTKKAMGQRQWSVISNQ
jgi:hypothetical protein